MMVGRSVTRLTLIDAHPLIYRNLYSPGTVRLQNSKGMKTGAFYGFLRSYLTIKERLQPTNIVVIFDGGFSNREQLFPGYKSLHRARDSDFTRQLADLHTFVAAVGLPMLLVPPLEADDLISLYAQQWRNMNEAHQVYIVSSDRDFFQIIRRRITLFDDRSKFFFGPKEVQAEFGVPPKAVLLYKALFGDTADQIPGIPGFGKVTALKVTQMMVRGENPLTLPQIEIFNRNLKLIRLPGRFEHLPISKKLQQHVKDRCYWYFSQFTGMREDSQTADPLKAQSLLDEYECKSLTVYDFLQRG